MTALDTGPADWACATSTTTTEGDPPKRRWDCACIDAWSAGAGMLKLGYPSLRSNSPFGLCCLVNKLQAWGFRPALLAFP